MLPNLEGFIKFGATTLVGTFLLSAWVWYRKVKSEKVMILKDRRDFELDKIKEEVRSLDIDSLIREENERLRRDNKN